MGPPGGATQVAPPLSPKNRKVRKPTDSINLNASIESGRSSQGCSGAGSGVGGGRGGAGGGVEPGTYIVTLTANGKTLTKPVTVLQDRWLGEK